MSNFKTLKELVQDVITELSMYRGTGTQKYAEDRIADKIIRTFIDVFEQRFWSYNTDWYKYTLSGSNGLVGENVSLDIKDFNDIEFIKDESGRTLNKLHDSTNPYKITGTIPAYYKRTNTDKKIFQVVPFNSIGDVFVRGRTRPTQFEPETVIPFDSNLLIYKVCWDYVCDDGNSLAQIDKYKQLYEQRYNHLLTQENEGVINYNDDIAYNPLTSWR